jgi:hypothetical protein
MIFDSFHIGLLRQCLNWPVWKIFLEVLQFVEVYCGCLNWENAAGFSVLALTLLTLRI